MPYQLSERLKAYARGDEPESQASVTSEVVETEQVSPVMDEVGVGADDPGLDGRTGDGTDAVASTEVEKSESSVDLDQVAPESTKQDQDDSAWITDDIRLLARSYGFEDADLTEFSSAKEFDKAARLYERRLAALVKPPEQPGTQPAGTQQPGQAEQDALPDLDLEKFKAGGYDDQTVELVEFTKKLADSFKAAQDQVKFLKEQEDVRIRQQQEMMVKAHLQTFHNYVNTLDESRFGRTVDKTGKPLAIDPALEANRRKLFEQADIIARGIQSRAAMTGQQPVYPSFETIIKRAEAMAFADDIRQAERERVTKELREQSARRRPVGASKPLTGSRPAKDLPSAQSAAEIAAHPSIRKLWSKFQEENGTQKTN